MLNRERRAAGRPSTSRAPAGLRFLSLGDLAVIHRLSLFAVAVALAAACSPRLFAADAPNRPQGAEALAATGKVEDVSDDIVRVKVSDSDTWLVKINPGETKLEITGTAEPGYLHKDLHVRLTGEIDGKGTLQSEIESLEIFTPQNKNALGLFDEKDKSASAKPVKKPGPGTYQIRAKILSLKEKELVMLAGGKKIFGTLAAEPELKVVSEDLSMVHEGDEATIGGWYLPSTKAAAQKPGQAVAEELTITLSKPLVAVKKPTRAAKTAKSKSRKMDADADGEGLGTGSAPASISDPFGVDKK
jgi:hypothetical protein